MIARMGVGDRGHLFYGVGGAGTFLSRSRFRSLEMKISAAMAVVSAAIKIIARISRPPLSTQKTANISEHDATNITICNSTNSFVVIATISVTLLHNERQPFLEVH
jgi:hypothetical protein